jgi:hypothetical protein
VFAILLIATGMLIAGDAERWNFQTVKAKAAALRFEQTTREANATHQRVLTDARRLFIADLDAAKVEATKAGNLDEAIRLRDAIGSLHKTMPVVENDNAPRPAADNSLRDMIGNWNFAWGTTGTKINFVVTENGQAIFGPNDKRQLTIHDGRILCISRGPTNFELIPANGRLIVLGWTRGRLDPLKNQPNHVGIATRAE